MPHKNDSISLPALKAMGTLTASATLERMRTSRNTIHTTPLRFAPRAMRIPISLVRRVTLYAMAP